MHCNEPTCVSVCLVGAFKKTDTGAVIYDETKCIGCRYCMQACPFEVPRYEWSSVSPRIQKCKMCYERIAAGGKTACAEACMFDATVFGDRDDLIKEARKRIDANPATYVNYIYGLTEVGGTSVFVHFEHSFRETRSPNEPPEQSDPAAFVESSLASSKVFCCGRRGFIRYPLDNRPPFGGGEVRGGRKTKKTGIYAKLREKML